MMGSIAVITDLVPMHSCHSSIREIRVKNVPEHIIETPLRSRITRLNETHEFNGGQEALS